MILVQLTEAIEATRDVSPYTNYVYGFLVLMLLVACGVFYYDRKYWQEKYIKNQEDTVVILHDVSKYLTEDAKGKVSEDIKELANKIENLTNELRRGK